MQIGLTQNGNRYSYKNGVWEISAKSGLKPVRIVGSESALDLNPLLSTSGLIVHIVGTDYYLGSEEMVTINQLVDVACSVENRQLKKNHINGPLGVRGRNSDNRLIKEKIGWEPNYPLAKGIEQTYRWIKEQLSS